MFITMVKRVAIDVAEYIALLLGILFFYFKMSSFIKAAIILKVVNGQILSYTAFALLLIILPIALLSCFRKLSKGGILRLIFYGFAASIFIGTISDLISYKFFIDYTHIEGNTVFVNLMWNMPNALGVVMSIIVGTLYVSLGIYVKRKRRISFVLYVITFLMSHLPPIFYSFATIGTWPRETYLQKSLYVLIIQLLLLTAFAVASTSRSLWKSHIWN